MLTRIIVHPHNCSSERTNFHLSTERNVCRSHIRIVAAYLSLLSMAVPSTTSAADLVGRTVGSLSCTQTGGAMYTIPIELKDGYSSFTPELALVYNSQSGNGIMGIGWSIAGMSSISASGKSIYYDGTCSAMEVNGNDTYYLDGQRLILKSGANGKKGAQYVTEEESFCKIYVDSAFSSTPKSFIVKRPNGSIYKYGSSNAGAYRYPSSNSQAAFTWLLDYAEDKDGNYIRYNYTQINNVPYLNYITYGTNKYVNSVPNCNVYFTYDNSRPDTIVTSIKSSKYKTTRRLSCIRCRYFGNAEYQKYTLEYSDNGPFSRLVSVKESGTSVNETYRATEFEWKNLPTSNTELLPSSFGVTVMDYETQKNSYFVAGDINRDGRTDLITITPRQNYHSLVKVFTEFGKNNRGNYQFEGVKDYQASSSYSYSKTFDWQALCFHGINSSKTFNGGLIGHFNKSATNSLVIPKFATDDDGFRYALFELPIEGYESHNKIDGDEMPAYGIADFNKDGNDVIMYIDKVNLRNKSITINYIDFDFKKVKILRDAATLSISSLPNDDIKECIVTDFNGDGFPDILLLCSGCSVMLWNCNGNFSANSYSIISNVKFLDTVCPCDINGDGLADLLINENSSTTWKIAINTGKQDSGLFSTRGAAALSGKSIRRQSDNDASYYCMATDFDADGISDFIIGYKFGNSANTAWVHTLRNGDMSIIKETTANNYDLSTQSCHITAGDFDGDGTREILTFGADLLTGSADGIKPCRMYKNPILGPEANRIVSIVDGCGKKTSISYNSLFQSGYTNTAPTSWPMMRFASSMSVMTASTESSNTASYTTRYAYSNGLLHTEGKGFLGFGKITSEAAGLKTEQTYNINTKYYAPYLSSVITRDSSGKMQQSADTYTYSFADNGAIGKSYKKLLKTESHSNNTKKEYSSLSYSNYHYGMPSNVTSNGNGLSSTVTKYTFKDVTTGGKWIIGMPLTEHSKSTSTWTYDGNPDYFYNKTEYQYDSNNRVMKQTDYASNVDEQWGVVNTQIYSYDRAGKILEIKSVAYTSSDTLSTTYEYDSYGRLSRECAPDNSATSYTYDIRGRLSQKCDERNHTRMYYTYDAMGRMKRSINKSESNVFKPDTTIINYTSEGEYAIKKTTTSTFSPQATEYYDAFGRKVADGIVHFNGCEFITESVYGSRGTLDFVSSPHPKGTHTETGTTYRYDAICRPVEVIDADGVSVTHEYDGSNVIITEKGVQTTYEYDSSGLLLSKTNPESGDIYYYYKAGGRYDRIVLSYMSGDDKESKFEYDNYGRLTKITDPNGNIRRNVYNTEGRIKIRYFDSNIEYFTYNKYGDILTKKYKPQNVYVTARYSYDSSRRIKSVTGPGFSESYTYDSTGRITSKTNSVTLHEEIENKDRTYTKKVSYMYSGPKCLISMSNELGGVSFPVVESYTYQNGWLKGIKLNGTSVWSLTGEDSFGRISSTSNSLSSTTYEYDEAGRLLGSDIKVKASVTGKIEHLQHSYSYDEYGRIEKKDGRWFGYDEQNRLKSWNGQGYFYDDLSNIVVSGAQNNIIYDGYKVKSVKSPVKSVWGNYQLFISNNGFNMPCFIRKIEENNASQSGEAYFNYDCNGKRLSMCKYGYLTFDKPVDREIIDPELECDYFRAYVDSNYEVEDGMPTNPLHYYYVGGDALTAHAVVEIHNDNMVIRQIGRDEQGSITSLIDTKSIKRYHYTPWGGYCDADGHVIDEEYHNGSSNKFFYRGFLGQEHYTDYGLINLNARMYNPHIGRFLTPDPVFDASRSILNFNPYVYGNNSPSIYTDSDGRLPILAWAGIMVFGFEVANAGVDLVKNVCEYGFNVGKYSWNQTVNSWKIDMGMFKGTFGQILNKWTWAGVNSIVGNFVSDVFNLCGKVDYVTEMDGMLALSGAMNGSEACTIGHYSLGPKGYRATWKDNLYVHEYGHYLQSQRMGVFWFPAVGSPSLLSAGFFDQFIEHDSRWFEQDASALGAHYFDRKYGYYAEGYTPHSKDHFQIYYYFNGGWGKYINPRTGTTEQDHNFPLYTPKLSFWDFIIL